MTGLAVDRTGVDVIVPVCGAVEAFARCAARVCAHTDLVRHRLVIVADGPQPPEGEAVLARLAAKPGLTVLRQEARRGFVAAVNRGMAASRRDVVLLNSDAAVTAGWLEKMQAAAASAPEVGTVTPFSNDATICSLPRTLVANALPAGHDVDSFAALVERCSERAYPRLPTGVGVCLLIKREVLDRLGTFDESAFGFGYGEESEFCARAGAAGYVHVLDDATFVFHEGQRSFGAARRRRVDAAQRVIRRRHPGYLPAVARFIREDPLRGLRERVTATLLPARRVPAVDAPRRVLHIVHGWPPFARGGTEHYAAALARRQAATREVTVFARLADPQRGLGEAVELLDGGVRVRLVVNNFTQRDPLSRNALCNRRLGQELRHLLDEVRPDLVHVHHLAGHAASLVGLVARHRVPLVMQVQDWWGACARANLVNRAGEPCPGPAPARCAACLPLTGLPPAGLLNRLGYRVRQALLRRAFAHADAYIAGSRFIAGSLSGLGLLPDDDRVHVLPYGVEPPVKPITRMPLTSKRPIVFGFVGALMPHKGAHVVVAAFAGVEATRAVLEVWGDPSANPAYAAEVARLAATGPVRLRGRFEEADREAVFAALDVLLVPSIGLESFGLVAREAMSRGVPVLASRRGALVELFEEGVCGAFLEPGDVATWHGWIERLADDPGLLDAWRRALPPVKGMDEHVAEVKAVYADVLARRGRR